MEKRVYKRIPVSLAGELLCDDILYSVYITDVSERGICSIVTVSNVPVDFKPKSKSDMQFQLESGETINLSCEERWSNDINNGFIKKVGWKINKSPIQFYDLLKTL